MVIRRSFTPLDGAKLPCEAGQGRTEYFEAQSGLRLRVTASGDRSWSVVWWSPELKRTRRFTIGNAEKMPVATARKRARSVLHDVQEEGRDPFEERKKTREQVRLDRQRQRQEREERANRVTFSKVCSEYIEFRRTTPVGKKGLKAAKRSLATWEGLVKNYIDPELGTKAPDEITREEVITFLEKVAKKQPTQPRHIQTLLSSIWHWMSNHTKRLGVRPSPSPVVSLPEIGKGRTRRTERLDLKGLWRFWRATENEGLAGLALRFSLLTACRVKEATQLPWSEINGKTWNLLETRNKSRRDREIPLSKQALDVLSKADHDSEYPFHRVQVHKPMKRICAAMKVKEPWQARDLRRTAATICGEHLHCDPFTISLVLGHAKPDTRMADVTAAYLHWNYADKLRETMDKLGAWIEDIVSSEKEPGGEVVSMKEARA